MGDTSAKTVDKENVKKIDQSNPAKRNPPRRNMTAPMHRDTTRRDIVNSNHCLLGVVVVGGGGGDAECMQSVIS